MRATYSAPVVSFTRDDEGSSRQRAALALPGGNAEVGQLELHRPKAVTRCDEARRLRALDFAAPPRSDGLTKNRV